MNNSYPFIFLVALFAVQPARADTYADCIAAIEAGDLETAKGIALTMLRFTNVTDPKKQEMGAQCLTGATGEPHVYSMGLARFLPSIEAEKVEEQRIIDAKAALEASEALERARLNAEAAAEAKAVAAERAEAAKKQAVWKRVSQACNELYADDPNLAVTNKVCLDLFLMIGLPLD